MRVACSGVVSWASASKVVDLHCQTSNGSPCLVFNHSSPLNHRVVLGATDQRDGLLNATLLRARTYPLIFRIPLLPLFIQCHSGVTDQN